MLSEGKEVGEGAGAGEEGLPEREWQIWVQKKTQHDHVAQQDQ